MYVEVDTEALWAETEAETEALKPEAEARPRHLKILSRRDQGEALEGLEAASRPRRQDRGHILSICWQFAQIDTALKYLILKNYKYVAVTGWKISTTSLVIMSDRVWHIACCTLQ